MAVQGGSWKEEGGKLQSGCTDERRIKNKDGCVGLFLN